MNGRGWELVTANESTFVAEPLLDPIVVENGKGYAGFPDPSGADESDWTEVFGELDDLFD